MSETPETEIQVADAAIARNDYDFNIKNPDLMSVGNIIALAKLAAKGGMSDPKGAEGLAIRAVFGLQMGFTPVEGMQGLYLIEGKPVVGAQLLGKRIKQSKVYDYKVVEHSAKECKLEGFSVAPDGSKESLGFAAFTMEQAAAAGLADKAIWKRYPENMLFARAMANLYRFHMPDLIGMPFLTEGEDIVPDGPPEPSVSEQAATAALERAQKGRKKDKDEPKPEPPVIEAEFQEEPSVPPESASIAPVVEESTPVHAAPTTEAPAPLHVEMGGEAPTIEQLAEQPISAGEFNPFEAGAETQNRFAKIEGWGEPEPEPGLTPNLGVVGYHHIIKGSDSGMWAVFDRATGVQLEKIQVPKGDQSSFDLLVTFLSVADKMHRHKDAALSKAALEAGPSGALTPNARVALAVKQVREAQKKAKAPEAAEPNAADVSGDSGGEPAVRAALEGAQNLDTLFETYRAMAAKAGKDIAEFWDAALVLLSDPSVAEMSADKRMMRLNVRFTEWKNTKEAEQGGQ